MVVPDNWLSNTRFESAATFNELVKSTAFLALTIPSFVKTLRIVSTELDMTSTGEKRKLDSSRAYSIHLKHIHSNFERVTKGKESTYPPLVFESKPKTN